MAVYLKVSWSVKFRALGVTFGNYSDHRSLPLPSYFSLAQSIIHTPYNYNDHGIQITVSLSDAP